MLQQVELASTFFNNFFKLATTKFCCVTMFEVGGNTCKNATLLRCKLKKNVARITGPLYNIHYTFLASEPRSERWNLVRSIRLLTVIRD